MVSTYVTRYIYIYIYIFRNENLLRFFLRCWPLGQHRFSYVFLGPHQTITTKHKEAHHRVVYCVFTLSIYIYRERESPYGSMLVHGYVKSFSRKIVPWPPYNESARQPDAADQSLRPDDGWVLVWVFLRK